MNLASSSHHLWFRFTETLQISISAQLARPNMYEPQHVASIMILSVLAAALITAFMTLCFLSGAPSSRQSSLKRMQLLVRCFNIWVVVKFLVPFWGPIIIRQLLFRVPKRDHNFDNHSYEVQPSTLNSREAGAFGASRSHLRGLAHPSSRVRNIRFNLLG